MELQEAPSKKKRLLWSIVAMVCAFVGWFLFQLFGPNPRIVVSKETTVITSPLRDDGLPDYQAYWRDLGRDGVTFDNNGAVLFWQAIWPGELEPEDRLRMSEALGFEKEPDSSDTLQAPYAREVRDAVILWRVGVEKQRPPGEESEPITSREHPNFYAANQFAEEVIDAAMSRPWTSKQVPPLADWVARNEKPFSLLIEASQQPKWWSPSPSLLKEPYSGGMTIDLPEIQTLRDVARAFCVRSMWHAGEGRYREAWTDLTASFRLARFVGQGPTLIGQLVAIAIDGINLNHTVTLLQHGELDAAFARQVLDNLTAMKVSCDMAKSFDEGERIMFADMAITMARDGSQLTSFDYGTTPLRIGYFANLSIDWNVTLRDGNRWHDQLVAAMRHAHREERLGVLAEFDDELAKTASSARYPLRFAAGFMNTQTRSTLVSDTVAGLMLSAVSAAMNAEDRTVTLLDLTRVAAALAVYRAEQGEYPDKLAQLVPTVVSRVPDDLYSGKPFIYKRMPDGGYLLYSVFENGKDDGGTVLSGEIGQGEWAEEESTVEYPEYDMVIRMPMPKFELPSTPEFVE